MQINKAHNTSYSSEILNLSLSFQNKQCLLGLTLGDFVSFVKKYMNIPNSQLDSYADMSLLYLKSRQAIRLQEKVKYYISKLLDNYYFLDAPSDGLYHPDNEFLIDGFEDMIKDNYIPTFVDGLGNIVNQIYLDGSHYITKPISLAEFDWEFHDDFMCFKDKYTLIQINRNFINIICEYLTEQYSMLGKDTFNYASEYASKYRMMDFQSFEILFPKDIEILKSNEVTLEGICNLFNKYNIGKNY